MPHWNRGEGFCIAALVYKLVVRSPSSPVHEESQPPVTFMELWCSCILEAKKFIFFYIFFLNNFCSFIIFVSYILFFSLKKYFDFCVIVCLYTHERVLKSYQETLQKESSDIWSGFVKWLGPITFQYLFVYMCRQCFDI